MTICYFSAQYLPTVGGVERYTWNLARRTVAAGHRAIVVTSALPNLPEHEIDGDGIEIYRLPVWPVMNGRFPVIKPGARFHALTAQIWAQKLDFCVVQTRMYTQSVWAARAAKRRGIPMLVIDHSTGYMPMGNGLLGACGRLYEQVACRLVRGTGAPFYGVSAAACRWLHTFGITAAGTMPNAIDPAALEQEAAHAPDWRAKLNLGDRKIVLFVGRLIPEKGAVLAVHRNAGKVAHMLVGAGQLVEQRGFAAVLIAGQGKGQRCTGGNGGAGFALVVAGGFVQLANAGVGYHLVALFAGGGAVRCVHAVNFNFLRIGQAQGQLITAQLHFNGVPHGGRFAQRYLGAGGQPHIQQVVAQLALTAYHADDCILPNVQVT